MAGGFEDASSTLRGVRDGGPKGDQVFSRSSNQQQEKSNRLPVPWVAASSLTGVSLICSLDNVQSSQQAQLDLAEAIDERGFGRSRWNASRRDQWPRRV